MAELGDPLLKQITPTAKTYTQDEFATMSYSASGDTRIVLTDEVSIEKACAR